MIFPVALVPKTPVAREEKVGPSPKDETENFVIVDDKHAVKGPTVPGVGAKVGSGKGGMSLPPEIDLTVAGRHRFRFQAGAASVINSVSYANLCNMLQVGTGAHLLQGIISSVRLRSVTIWPALSTSTTDTVALEWSAAGEFFKDELKNRTLPEGQTQTGAVRFTPPKKSVASFWSTTSNNILFYITAPSGSVCDVEVDFTLAGAYAPPTAVTVVGSVTIGNFYYGYLDGITTHIWAPVVNASQF